jgi:hypothetical protein
MYKRQVSVEDRCHGVQYHDSKLCASGRQVGGLLSYLSHHPTLRLSVTLFTLSVCHCIHGDATPRLLLLRSSDPALPEFCRRRIFLFHPSPSQRDVQYYANERQGHYMPMTASCVRKVPPFLLRPNSSTDFHFFPSFFRSFTTFS